MSQQVQELIEKIKEEGIQTAEKESHQIIADAKAKAETIIEQANKEADLIIEQGKREVQKLNESTEKSLQQASRDTILSLRKEIERTLKNVVDQQVQEALSADQLASILTEVIKAGLEGKDDTVELTLNKKDAEKLQSTAIAKLSKQLKNPIKVQASQDIGKGFTISYDEGKSSFDFTDESLVRYLTTFLNSQVSKIVSNT